MKAAMLEDSIGHIEGLRGSDSLFKLRDIHIVKLLSLFAQILITASEREADGAEK